MFCFPACRLNLSMTYLNKMENGEWKKENGKWKMENGKWKMENYDYLFHPINIVASLQRKN